MKLSLNFVTQVSVIFFILIASSQNVLAAEQECEKNAEGQCVGGFEDPKCPSRPHIVRCAAAHLDLNKNNALEKEELEAAIDSLPWYARGVLKIIGSVPSIMNKCDADGDGAISIEHDMEATKETCLASCFKKKAFKSAFFPDCEL